MKTQLTRRDLLHFGTGAIALGTMAEAGALAEFLDWMRRCPKFSFPSPKPRTFRDRFYRVKDIRPDGIVTLTELPAAEIADFRMKASQRPRSGLYRVENGVTMRLRNGRLDVANVIQLVSWKLS